MRSYETEQKKLLIALFRANPDRFYTVDEVAEIISGDSDDRSCGKSTVYRLVSRLCDEGVVVKHAREGSRKFYYQYVKGRECSDHLHLQCESCGRIIHLDDKVSTQVLREILICNGFSIDGARTLMAGVCAECRSAGGAS